MGKPKVITRAATLLKDAQEIVIGRNGHFDILIESGITPEPGRYKIVPVVDATDMVAALGAEDARESKLERSRKRRKAKKAPAKRAKKKAAKRKPTAKQRKIRYKGL